MTVELTNNVVEMSRTFYDVEKVESRQYGDTEIFRFYFGSGKWSKEYRTPTYTYRVIER